MSESPILVPCLGFLCLCWLVLSKSHVLVFVSSYYNMFCFIIISLKPICFLLRNKDVVDLNGKGSGEELGGAEGMETII